MKTVSYESIKADQAWLTVTQHLQRRSQLLIDGVSFLEKHPNDHTLAGRLVVIQYHLRATIRRLADESSVAPSATHPQQQIKRQWLMVHQLHFLLRQIDEELSKLGLNSAAFRAWMTKKQQRFTYKTASPLYLN
ncbi:hypothetical protein ACO2Q8_03230 [Larkinella sp. VNQ87]|uniref:hypothetical protein n=1 Tax=Larkinella sp. VNQ87 TaxID=3400921 RepID=UPI003C04DD1D